MNSFGKLLFVFMLTIAYVFAHGSNWHMMDWGHMYFGSGGVIMLIALIILIAIGAYLIARNKNLLKTDDSETPLKILKRRYAKGEISKQEFDRMRKDML